MSEIQIQEMQDKILKGIALSYERLIEKKKKNDEELVFADENGKIIRVKARDL